ncbi:DNA repair protein RecO [bacterium]|nr:DNA repair protein RecO [bacterium]
MASLTHATGIVLSRKDHREADRWYSVFTREHGKVELLARGGHKILAKLTPHLEMPAIIDFHVVNGRQFDTIAGTDRLRAFSNLYTDLTRLVLAQNAFHLVDIGTRPQEPDLALYELLEQWLETVDAAPAITSERAGFLLGSFATKLLSLIGYRPELTRCLDCKTAIAPGAYRWHALKGGVVCRSCVDRDNAQWFAARALSDDALKLIRFGLSEPFPSQLRPHLPAELLVEYHDAVEALIVSHFPVIPANSLRGACLF